MAMTRTSHALAGQDDMVRPVVGPIAYLTGSYPMASHTFIQREIAALRGLGARIVTVSVREPEPSQLTGPEERDALAETLYLLRQARNPRVLLRAGLRMIAAPHRTAATIALAARTARPGLKGALWQAFYVIEAAILAGYLKDAGVRHVHNHFADSSCTLAMLVSKFSKIPFSFTLHGPSDLFEPKSWHLNEKIARADFVACISHFARSQAMLFSDPVHWPKLRIVHCGVEPDRYRSPSVRSEAGLRLLFVGRLAAVKGLRVLFAALERTRNTGVSLTVIGDGPERAHAEAEAARIAGISLLGYQSQGAVAEAFAHADVLVLPSFAEGVPVVLMEAMAAGLPVIATRVGGVSELVQDGVSGLLVAPGDVNSLHNAIMALARDPALRRAMGKVGAATVLAEFDSQTEAARLLSLFSGKGGCAPRPVPYSL